MRIFLVGYMGCGKTTVGKRLATRLDLRFLDLDHYLESKHGAAVSEQFEQLGEAVFRERERDAIVEVCTQLDDILVSTGGGAPCFYDNMEQMKRFGVTIYLKMTASALASRLKNARKSRPLLKGKSDQELVDFIQASLQAREPFYEQAKVVVSALSIDIDGLVNRVYHTIK